MTEKIEVFVREVRNSPVTAGHIFFVYTKDDGSPARAVSLAPRDGAMGMMGGPATVKEGLWDGTHADWREPDEKAAVSLGSVTGADLSANYEAINRAYNLDAIKSYWFQSQNSNAAGSFAAEQGGLNIDWSRSPYKLYGLNYDKKTEADDPNGHTFTYDDGYGNSGVVKTAFDGKLISDEFSSVNRTHDTVRPDGSGGYTLEEELNGVLKLQQQVHADGDSIVKYYDPNNTHPYSQLGVSTDANNKVTGAQIVLDQSVINAGGAIGQIFGSALGSALGGKDQITKLANSVVGGTIGSLIGQKFVLVLATSMGADLSKVSVTDVFAGQNLANAGIGAISSFLTAELGSALKIPGFGEQLFDAAANGFTTSVLTQVTTKIGEGLTFNAAIDAIDWSRAVSGAISAEGLHIENLVGTFLGQLLVPAKSHAGAVGGQLFGAIGSFLLPGIGSFLGDILGTVIFDAFSNTPHPAATDLLDQSGRFYGFTNYQTSEGGSYDVPDQMAAAAISIINAYLSAVNGAALDHSKQVTLGYQTDPGSYIAGVPSHPAAGVFFAPGYAVQAAALDVLQHTEVIGGDLLLKRAHHNSSFNDPVPVPPPDPTNQNGDPGATGAPIQPTAAGQLAVMSGDLGVAQDYENYLNNREAINALMAANPDSAFTAGWIATFARVNELGLNHVNASDFLGGLVGYLDSVNKAGLGAGAANASVKHGSGSSIVVEVHVGNGVEVPGSLSAFADQTNLTSDASGQTVQLVFGGELAAAGFHGPGSATFPSGVWQVTGTAGSNLWFGSNNAPNEYHDNGPNSSDILVGGSLTDVIHAGEGWDFIDGGAATDFLFGENGNDILRGGTGGDFLFGGSGDDTYAFARGDGADTVLDESTQQVGADSGTDTLAFDPGIARSDIVVWQSGNDLVVGVRDPAHPNVPFAQLTDRITLQHTEVIGGDLLLKHQNLNWLDRNRNRGGTRRHFRASGWRPAKGATASMACIHKRFA
jgi:hypothetical protein